MAPGPGTEAPAANDDWLFLEGQESLPNLVAWGQLGSGRHFESWLAWSVRHRIPVVVKLPRPSRLEDQLTIDELAREAATGAALQHPGVQRLLDVRLDHGPPFVILEYVEGPTLSRLVDDNGALPGRDVVLFGLQLAGTLAFLQGQGFAHLDVKPGNVAVRDGRPVLLDLGIARQLGAIPGRGETQGSPPYMAPEQSRRHPVSPAMDVFGLGATLFELRSGSPPFKPRRSGSGWSHPQRTRNAPSLARLGPDTPEPLAGLVDAMLNRDPDLRPAMAEVMTGLHRVLVEEFGEALWPSRVDRYIAAGGAT